MALSRTEQVNLRVETFVAGIYELSEDASYSMRLSFSCCFTWLVSIPFSKFTWRVTKLSIRLSLKNPFKLLLLL